jgi:hypothetical protein
MPAFSVLYVEVRNVQDILEAPLIKIYKVINKSELTVIIADK